MPKTYKSLTHESPSEAQLQKDYKALLRKMSKVGGKANLSKADQIALEQILKSAKYNGYSLSKGNVRSKIAKPRSTRREARIRDLLSSAVNQGRLDPVSHDEVRGLYSMVRGAIRSGEMQWLGLVVNPFNPRYFGAIVPSADIIPPVLATGIIKEKHYVTFNSNVDTCIVNYGELLGTSLSNTTFAATAFAATGTGQGVSKVTYGSSSATGSGWYSKGSDADALTLANDMSSRANLVAAGLKINVVASGEAGGRFVLANIPDLSAASITSTDLLAEIRDDVYDVHSMDVRKAAGSRNMYWTPPGYNKRTYAADAHTHAERDESPYQTPPCSLAVIKYIPDGVTTGVTLELELISHYEYQPTTAKKNFVNPRPSPGTSDLAEKILPKLHSDKTAVTVDNPSSEELDMKKDRTFIQDILDTGSIFADGYSKGGMEGAAEAGAMEIAKRLGSYLGTSLFDDKSKGGSFFDFKSMASVFG